MQKKKLLGVLLISIIVLQSTVFAATGTVRTDVLNVRENPDVTSAVIGQSKLDGKVAITDVSHVFNQKKGQLCRDMHQLKKTKTKR